jgi:holo-[acyl-carrier protein] synthase
VAPIALIAPATPPGVVVGVGVDLCEVGRMAEVLARTPSFAARVFTEAERGYCDRRRRNPAERYAARFAAKEAVLKAMGLGIGACGLREIEVVRAASGAPSVALHGRAVVLAAERGITGWHLTLSHTDTVAIAQATAVTAVAALGAGAAGGGVGGADGPAGP